MYEYTSVDGMAPGMQHFQQIPATSHHAVGGTKTPWMTGFFKRFPWLGFGALFGALVSLAACAVLLVYSDGQPIAAWTFQPTVYLAIATTVMNILITFALSEGVNVAWWYRARRSGTTVSDLHRVWSYGHNIKDALLAGRHTNIIAVASLLAMVAQINNPLLQRASRVVIQNTESSTVVKVQLASEIPSGYTGYLTGREYSPNLYTAEFLNIVNAFNNNASIPLLAETGCSGKCAAKINGIGLKVDCNSSLVPFDLIPRTYPNGSIMLGPGTPVDGIDVFDTDFGWGGWTNQGNLSLTTLYKSTDECQGQLITKNCTLQTAMVQYSVIIDGNASSIMLDPSTNIYNDSFIGLVPIISSGSGYNGPTTLGGFYRALSNKFGSTSHMRFVGAMGYENLNTGNGAMLYAAVNTTGSNSSSYSGGMGPWSSCGLYFYDPLPDMLAGARELMFRTSVAAVNSSTLTQTVTAVETGRIAIYRSNYFYLTGAIAVTLIAALAITASFNGYSDLGRSFTLNPIEVAKAFDAPLLRGHDSNAPIDDLITAVGTRSVQYGAVAADHQEKPQSLYDSSYKSHSFYENVQEVAPQGPVKLALASETEVRSPWEGETFVG